MCPLREVVPQEESFTRGWKSTLLTCIVLGGLLGVLLSGCVKRTSVVDAERRAKTFDCITVPTGDIEAGAKRERATGLAAADHGRSV